MRLLEIFRSEEIINGKEVRDSGIVTERSRRRRERGKGERTPERGHVMMKMMEWRMRHSSSSSSE